MMSRVVIEACDRHRHGRSARIEIRVSFDLLEAISLVQPVEHFIDVLAELLIRPADSPHDVELARKSIRCHSVTLPGAVHDRRVIPSTE
jgi:hypothetical protein